MVLTHLSAIGYCEERKAEKEQHVPPVLEFPQIGVDDPLRYQDYTTRFYQDTRKNVVQISIHRSSGRVVHLWANGANESISFTARTIDGSPPTISWPSTTARVREDHDARTLWYELSFSSGELVLGHFLLSSMRRERDFQYVGRHLLPYGSEPFYEPELLQLIKYLRQLTSPEREAHLALLRAKTIDELIRRLDPTILVTSDGPRTNAQIVQPTFDGKNTLSLFITSDQQGMQIERDRATLRIRGNGDAAVRLSIGIRTDSPPLTPLEERHIFNQEFLDFYDRVRSKDGEAHRLRAMWLERSVRSLGLLSYEEKLMAGLPNFATYFGRDMIMSALMLEPIWSPIMLEHTITAILKKLSPTGEVSHEESLGSQAIRENASLYNHHIEKYFQLRENSPDEARQTLAEAKNVLENLQEVREDYKMVDDDFQFPTLVARYLTHRKVTAERKKSFLQSRAIFGEERLRFVLRNLIYVTNRAAPYAERPDVTRLIAFPRLSPTRWLPGSWRDSNAGYANGKYAMDVNVIWVPKALEAAQQIFTLLKELAFTREELIRISPELQGTVLESYFQTPSLLEEAIRTWRTSDRHFWVEFEKTEIHNRVTARIQWLPDVERQYWLRVFESSTLPERIRFLSLSLDSFGKPIPVANTDPAMLLFLENILIPNGPHSRNEWHLSDLLNIIVSPYPVGLFIEQLGILVANDAYAPIDVWEAFRRDRYHSPYVVWGREVNLLLLGFMHQLSTVHTTSNRWNDPVLNRSIQKLRTALLKTRDAVEASGLKHSELWTYRIDEGRLIPTRYSTGTDIQLWNVTDLAVQFLLDQFEQD
jgi:hypothetical protein